MIICKNCRKIVDEHKILCPCCGYNLQERLEYMQQIRQQIENEEKENWFNKVVNFIIH